MTVETELKLHLKLELGNVCQLAHPSPFTQLRACLESSVFQR